MFTVGMNCSRMMVWSIRVGCIGDCITLDLEKIEVVLSGNGERSGVFRKEADEKNSKSKHV